MIEEYAEHYRTERALPGIGNEIIDSDTAAGTGSEIVETERLGGLLRSYWRAAA